MKEVWKDILGFEGVYQVSNLGNVKSLDHYTIQDNNGTKMKRLYKGKILKPYKTKAGYLRVQLSNNHNQYFVHRLVAETFIDNHNNYNIINHKDGNKENNCITNLEWCTQSDNIKHAWKNNLSKPHSVENILKHNIEISKPILQFDLKGNFIKEFSSIHEASRELNLIQINLSRTLRQMYGYKTCGGFIWKYK